MKTLHLTPKQAASLACAVTDRSLLPSEFEEALERQVKLIEAHQLVPSPDTKRDLSLLRSGASFGPAAVRFVHAQTLKGRSPYLLEPRNSKVPPPLIVSHYKKGGTGKTTVLVNMAISMAMQGIRVLCIDADPQGSLTELLGVNVEDPSLKTMQHILFGHASNQGKPVSPYDAVIRIYDNAVLDLIPSDIELSSFDRIALPRNNRERLFDRLLREHAVFFSRYDIILVDTSPSQSLLTLNLMVPASHIMMPVSLDVLSMKSMKLMQADQADLIELGASSKDWFVVANASHPSMVHSRGSLEMLRSNFGSQLMNTVIPSYAGVSRQGWSDHKGATLIEREPNALASKRIATLALEVLERVIWRPMRQGVLIHERSEGSLQKIADQECTAVQIADGE